jgi:hypothetical protein
MVVFACGGTDDSNSPPFDFGFGILETGSIWLKFRRRRMIPTTISPFHHLCRVKLK